jgi:hypothetical protein
MHPNSIPRRKNNPKVDEYDNFKVNIIEGWEFQLDELICKVVGSSLKPEDKKEALKKLAVRIIANI